MYKTKLCLGINGSLELDPCDQIRLLHRVGFDGFFTGWSDNVKKYRTLADNIGMTYQSIHAPFERADKMWTRSDEANAVVDELLLCVKTCSEFDVPILVVHPYIGFETISAPTEDGISNFRRVVDEAGSKDVTIAFENVEGEEYLASLMCAFAEYKNVGFCWDSGHELCYNKGKDMLALYGDRLVATHLNDNLGVSSFEGKITFTDDLHLLPFDGVHDWNDVVKRLNKCNYHDILTFELTRRSKPNRHENDKYQKMSVEEYVTECYSRACRLAYMKQHVQ